MTPQPFDSAPFRQTLTSLIQGSDFRKATFAGPKRGTASVPWARVTIRPVELQGQVWLQFSYFDAKKDITKNSRGADVVLKVEELIAVGFAAIHVTTDTEEIDLRLTKKGKLQIGRKRTAFDDAGRP